MADEKTETGISVVLEVGGEWLGAYGYRVFPFAMVLADVLQREAPAWPLPGERAHQDALWFCSGGDQLL